MERAIVCIFALIGCVSAVGLALTGDSYYAFYWGIATALGVVAVLYRD